MPLFYVRILKRLLMMNLSQLFMIGKHYIFNMVNLELNKILVVCHSFATEILS